MGDIFYHEQDIIIAAAQKMLALGSESSQRILQGKQSADLDDTEHEIALYLRTYQQKNDLTTDQASAILYELRELSGEFYNYDAPDSEGIPSDAVLYEDGTQVFYDDGNYVKYVA